MCEDLSDKLDDIFPVDQKTCLEALKKAALTPGVPFAVIYTLRLLVVQFFRETTAAALVADEELENLYVDAEDDEEIIEGEIVEGDPSPPDFSPQDFTGGSAEIVTGPERPMKFSVTTADEILCPEKLRCD